MLSSQLDSALLQNNSSGDSPNSPSSSPGAEFVISGSLTSIDRAVDPPALQGVPASPMPAFHQREDVQRMLRRWRSGVSLWGRILAASPREPGADRERYLHPNHSLHIR